MTPLRLSERLDAAFWEWAPDDYGTFAKVRAIIEELRVYEEDVIKLATAHTKCFRRPTG